MPRRPRPPAVQPPIRWPRGVTSAVCLTFDLDAETAWISRDPANAERLAVLSQGAYGPKVGVPLLLELLERNRLTATFFVPGWTAERYPEVVAAIHRAGHEVGHHGYLHEALEGRSRDEEEEILVKGARILEGITGEPPIGYRAPRYEITHETTGLLRKHGFLYASNLQDTIWPYLHAGAPPLVELPTTWILDDGPYFAYGIRPPLYRQIYPPAAVLSTWKDEFRGMHPLGGAFTLILHPQFIGRPSRVLMLQELLDYVRKFPGVWLTHGRELARWVASDAAGAGTDGRPRSITRERAAPSSGASSRWRSRRFIGGVSDAPPDAPPGERRQSRRSERTTTRARTGATPRRITPARERAAPSSGASSRRPSRRS